MPAIHAATFGLLGIEPRLSSAAVLEVEHAERRLGFRLPASVREWYCYEEAIDILAKHSNQDPPIPLSEFAVQEWKTHRLLPFKYENQGVCVWAILLDGSDDPPVFVDVDSDGDQWNVQSPKLSAYIYACVWDYVFVLKQPALVQAQNVPLTVEAIGQLQCRFTQHPATFGWPGSTQHRFSGSDYAILIWADEGQADWFVGARDEKSLEAALRVVWNLDGVGQSLYDCTECGKAVLAEIRGGS